MTNTTEDDERLIQEIVRARYGVTPEITRLASFNNDVYGLAFGDNLPGKVIKLAGQAHGEAKTGPCIRHEQVVLRALGGVGLPVPPVEWTQDDCPVPSRPFTLMPRLPGVTLNQSIAEAPALAETAWRKAGRFAAQIGHLGPAALPERAATPLGPETVRRAFAAHGLLRPPFTRILDEVEPLLYGERSLIHGDYGASQIVADANHFAVIDWEGGAPGFPLDMLGRIIAMTREYDRELGGNERRIEWLMGGYESETLLTDRTRHELHLWEMYNHLGVMSWKLGWWGEHDDHARAMAGRVEEWDHQEWLSSPQSWGNRTSSQRGDHGGDNLKISDRAERGRAAGWFALAKP